MVLSRETCDCNFAVGDRECALLSHYFYGVNVQSDFNAADLSPVRPLECPSFISQPRHLEVHCAPSLNTAIDELVVCEALGCQKGAPGFVAIGEGVGNHFASTVKQLLVGAISTPTI